MLVKEFVHVCVHV